MHFDNNEVGITIRSLRKSKQMSQETLSGLAGIARSHLSMIETGDKRANFETLCRLADALMVRPSELIFLIEEKSGQYPSPPLIIRNAVNQRFTP